MALLSILHCPLSQFPNSLPNEEHLEVYNTPLLLLLPREQIHTGGVGGPSTFVLILLVE